MGCRRCLFRHQRVKETVHNACIIHKNSTFNSPINEFFATLGLIGTIECVNRGCNQINFLFVANVVFQCYHFSKQFLSNRSKYKYLAFFITFCFLASLAKMVTLTTNIVYKISAQYWKYSWVQP